MPGSAGRRRRGVGVGQLLQDRPRPASASSASAGRPTSIKSSASQLRPKARLFSRVVTAGLASATFRQIATARRCDAIASSSLPRPQLRDGDVVVVFARLSWNRYTRAGRRPAAGRSPRTPRRPRSPRPAGPGCRGQSRSCCDSAQEFQVSSHPGVLRDELLRDRQRAAGPSPARLADSRLRMPAQFRDSASTARASSPPRPAATRPSARLEASRSDATRPAESPTRSAGPPRRSGSGPRRAPPRRRPRAPASSRRTASALRCTASASALLPILPVSFASSS